MNLRTEALDCKLVGRTLYAHTASGLQTAAGVSVSLAQATALHQELSIAASELSGVQMRTGDELYFVLDPKAELWDFDLTHDLRFQVVAESENTNANSGVIWDLAVKGVSSAEAFSDAKVTPDGTITFATLGACTAGVPLKTVEAGAGVANELVNDEFIMLALTLTADGALAATDITLICLRLWGTLNFTVDTGIRQMT